MNEQINTSDFVKRTYMDTKSPVVISDPFADKVPEDASLIHETPIGETIPAKDPLDETIADESWVSKSIPYEAPMGETITHEAPIGTNAGSSAALLNREESEHFRTRWNEIQGNFVDEPRAVQQADALVSEVIEQITQMFAKELTGGPVESGQ